jgi:hypothetical protein
VTKHFYNPLAEIRWGYFGAQPVFPPDAAETIKALVMGRPKPAPTTANGPIPWISWRQVAADIPVPERTFQSWMKRALEAREARERASKPGEAQAA